jgi:hypothetical protein
MIPRIFRTPEYRLGRRGALRIGAAIAERYELREGVRTMWTFEEGRVPDLGGAVAF